MIRKPNLATLQLIFQRLQLQKYHTRAIEKNRQLQAKVLRMRGGVLWGRGVCQG